MPLPQLGRRDFAREEAERNRARYAVVEEQLSSERSTPEGQRERRIQRAAVVDEAQRVLAELDESQALSATLTVNARYTG